MLLLDQDGMIWKRCESPSLRKQGEANKTRHLRERKIQCSALHLFTLKPFRTQQPVWKSTGSRLEMCSFNSTPLHPFISTKISVLSVTPVLLKRHAIGKALLRFKQTRWWNPNRSAFNRFSWFWTSLSTAAVEHPTLASWSLATCKI